MSPTLASSRVVFAFVGTFTDINKEIFAAVWIILRVCDMWHADGGWLLLFPHYWHYSPSPIDHIPLSHGRGSCYCPASVTQCPLSSVQCPHCVWCPGAAITGLHIGNISTGCLYKLSPINLVWGPLKCTKSNFNPVHVFLHFKSFCLVVLQLILASKLNELDQFKNFAATVSLKGGSWAMFICSCLEYWLVGS